MTKKVFISYSWDNQEHKDWVLNLADRLVESGIDVLLDQYELSVGKEMTYFMEKAMTSDKILVIMTPGYKIKADDRTSGVGYEYSLITATLFKRRPDDDDIIPILRQGKVAESTPSYLSTRIYHDMSDDSVFESNFFKLVRVILDKPEIVKPKLGETPDFENHIPEIDESISKLKNKEHYLRKKKSILFSEKGVVIFEESVKQIKQEIQVRLTEYEEQLGSRIIQEDKNRYGILVSTINFTGYFNIEGLGTNSASGAKIVLNFFKGPVGLDSSIDYHGARKDIYRNKYLFDLDENLQPIFKLSGKENDILKPNEVSNKIIRDLILNELKFRESKLK